MKKQKVITMKNNKIFFTTFVAAVISQVAYAQKEIPASQLFSDDKKMEPIMELTVLICIFLIVLIATAFTIAVTKKVNKMEEEYNQQKGIPIHKKSKWMELFHRKGEGVGELIKDHTYDHGTIAEFDNNPPSWFNWLFYVPIIWGAGYLLYYHVLDLGKLPIAEYKVQVEEAKKITMKSQEKVMELSKLPPYTTEDKLVEAQVIFAQKCAPCHGQKAEGLVGPNLTDEYWLHGGSYQDIFKTIAEGVESKGMQSWKKVLKPDELREIASYVNSRKKLNISNPAKPAQGDKYIGE